MISLMRARNAIALLEAKKGEFEREAGLDGRELSELFERRSKG
jgi:hypothetical protein